MSLHNYRELNRSELTELLLQACEKDNVKVVEEIATLTKQDMNHSDDYPFIIACQNGSLNVVKFLMTSDKMKNKVQADTDHGNGLFRACFKNQIEVVKYLLTSPDIEKHADIYKNKTQSFTTIAQSEEHKELLKYLICEYKLQKNKEVCEVVEQVPYIKQLYIIQEAKKLEQELPIKNIKSHKNKI